MSGLDCLSKERLISGFSGPTQPTIVAAVVSVFMNALLHSLCPGGRGGFGGRGGGRGGFGGGGGRGGRGSFGGRGRGRY